MVSKRALEKEIRRAAIIDAAEQLFFSKGLTQTTMDELCHAVHLSKRTLYVYFNSKRRIYFEIMIRGYRKLIAMLEEDPQPLPILDRLKQMADSIYRFSTQYPDYFAAIFSYENSPSDFAGGIPDSSREECYALGEQVFRKLADLIEAGQNTGIFRREADAGQTAIILWSCLYGILNTAKLKQNYFENVHNISTHSLVAQAIAWMIRSICNDSGGAL